MNRIVREDYPVSKLPEDLRDGLSGLGHVTLTIDWKSDEPAAQATVQRPERVKSLEDLFAMAEPTFKSLDEVTAHVRLLRDDWS